MGTVRIEDVLVEVDDLRHQLAEMRVRRTGQAEGAATVIASGSTLLDQAEQAAKGVDPPATSWLRQFWTGSHQEAAYPRLHAAEVHLVGLYDDDAVSAAIPAVRHHVGLFLDRGDPRRADADRLPTLQSPEQRRAVLQASMAAGYEESDLDHRRQRMFRNALIVATVISVLLLAAVTAMMVIRPEFAPVCFDSVRQEGLSTATGTPGADPGDPSETPVSTGLTINCPSGAGRARAPDPWDAPLVVMFGIIGATLSAAVTVRNLRPTSSVYDIPLVLSVLKLPIGALTAFIGVIAIRGGLVPGLSALDSPAEILVYSVVLGYAQQLATGFLDRRASTMGGNDR